MTMPKSLLSYFLKKRRIESKLTLRELSDATGIDNTYLSKIENNIITPNERKVNKLLVFYGVKLYSFKNCNFSMEYVYSLLKKLYFMEFSEDDLSDLNYKIKLHKNSVYLGHLDLVLWCYDALYVKYDDHFLIEKDVLENLLKTFSEKEQIFFLICKIMYHIRLREKEQSKKTFEILKKIKKNEWFGMLLYIKAYYNFYFMNYYELPFNIKKCKEILQKENNKRRYNSLLLLEANYHSKIGNYDIAVNKYLELKKIYTISNDPYNYGITCHNLGSLYAEQKKYSEAIPYYKEALHTAKENDTYFELAWCYYSIDSINKCREIINLASKVETQYTAYNYFLDWLSLMIDTPYSKRCLSILKKIEKNELKNLGPNTRNFLYIALSNQYKSNGELNLSMDYLKKILFENIHSSIGIG